MDVKPAKQIPAFVGRPEEAAINADKPVKLERVGDGTAEIAQQVQSGRDGAAEQAAREDAKATGTAKELGKPLVCGKLNHEECVNERPEKVLLKFWTDASGAYRFALSQGSSVIGSTVCRQWQSPYKVKGSAKSQTVWSSTSWLACC